jgi:DNA-binding transcriptional LysR family regulator
MAVNLTGLRCLVQIVESRLNVSAAAQAMHLSQPSVSRQLRQLEDALGFQVFARHGRSLVGITPAGTQAIEVARRVVRDVEGLHGFAAHARGEAGAELLIAAPQGYVLHLLPPLLSQLRERYPDIGVRIRTLGEGERVRAAEHDRCDMVMLSSAGDERPDGIAIPLFHWKRVAIVSREHPLAAHKGPLSLETLATWPLVTYEASRQPDSSFCRVMAAAGLSPKFACSAQDGDTLKAYAHAGLGVGLVAELALGPGDRASLRWKSRTVCPTAPPGLGCHAAAFCASPPSSCCACWRHSWTLSGCGALRRACRPQGGQNRQPCASAEVICARRGIFLVRKCGQRTSKGASAFRNSPG